MASAMSTPGSGTRATSPTVFQQQREELVREIAVVGSLLVNTRCILTMTGHGTGPPEHKPAESKSREYHHGKYWWSDYSRRCSHVQVGNEFGSVEALWSQFENFMGRPEGENGDEKEGQEGDVRPKSEGDAEGDSIVHER